MRPTEESTTSTLVFAHKHSPPGRLQSEITKLRLKSYFSPVPTVKDTTEFKILHVKLISSSRFVLRTLFLRNSPSSAVPSIIYGRSLVAGTHHQHRHCQNLFTSNKNLHLRFLSRKSFSKSYYCNCNTHVTRMASTASVQQKLAKVPDVDIDSSGRFKYILIKVYTLNDPAGSPSKEQFKYVVRGFADCPYHGDVYDRFVDTLKTLDGGGYDSECVGGGRITHGPKKIDVFGYSQGYGRADHSIAVEVLKKNFPADYNISWNNDGY